MPPSTRLVCGLLFIQSLHIAHIHGLQQLWTRKGRIKPFHGAPSDTDLDFASDSIAESSAADLIEMTVDNDVPIGETATTWEHRNDDLNPVVSPEYVILASNATIPVNPSKTATTSPPELSRRQWLQIGALAIGGVVTTGFLAPDIVRLSSDQQQNSKDSKRPNSKRLLQRQQPTTVTTLKKLQRVNVTDVVRATNINLTMECTTTCVSLDRYTFEKKATLKLPRWVPAFLVPPPKTIRKISDSEILIAALVAGSTVRE